MTCGEGEAELVGGAVVVASGGTPYFASDGYSMTCDMTAKKKHQDTNSEVFVNEQ